MIYLVIKPHIDIDVTVTIFLYQVRASMTDDVKVTLFAQTCLYDVVCMCITFYLHVSKCLQGLCTPLAVFKIFIPMNNRIPCLVLTNSLCPINVSSYFSDSSVSIHPDLNFSMSK